MLLAFIAHIIIATDQDGIYTILEWLSFVPSTNKATIPCIEPSDPISRRIDFMPTKTPYDPRCMLASDGGFFDRNSWREVMSCWAETVCVARARLGGIPVGVIAAEPRTAEVIVPADPSDDNSGDRKFQQAGQVWYPDSAHKTAQAIRDFDREHLPLFIFANWRGFSGGMRDMYEEILKYGSQIVDALRVYGQPIFVYLPPYAELRGGAWAVLDSLVNARYMEMYADPLAKGGVLEPEGTIEIRFKEKDLIKTIHRLDPIVEKVRLYGIDFGWNFN